MNYDLVLTCFALFPMGETARTLDDMIMKMKLQPQCMGRFHGNLRCNPLPPNLFSWTGFYLTQGSSTPNNLMGRVKTMWEPCLFRGRPPCPTQKSCKWGYLLFHRKRLKPRVLPWQQYSRSHFVSFVMYSSDAKFEDHCSNISGDILNSVLYRFSGTIYDVITSLICILQKREYL